MKYLSSLVLISFVTFVSAQTGEVIVDQNLPKGQQFVVDPVEIAKKPMNTVSAKGAFENQLGKEIQFFPDELNTHKVVPGWRNCLVATIHTSFDQHRPLVLSPDVIWLSICQGISIHINQNFDSMESTIFKANKPDKIAVQNDDLADGSSNWADLMHSFSDSTTKYVNDDYYAFFVPEFSTTTPIIHTSYEITMLEGFSQAFEYFGDSGCGIPYITLEGTEEDWQEIYRRMEKVEELGMELWAQELRGVIQQFIDVYHQKIDLDFWQRIYKDHDEYGGSYVSGWFIKFFPYLEDTGEMEEVDDPDGMFSSRAPKIYKTNDFLEGDRYLISRLTTDDFPSGIAEIDVNWNNYGTTYEMKVHAGFYGMEQYDDLSLKPAIAWAVRHNEATSVSFDYDQIRSEVQHIHNYWSPHAMNNLVDQAIYNKTQFSSATESYQFVKDHIIKAFTAKSNFNIDDLTGAKVDLLVLSNGTFLEAQSEELGDESLAEINQIVEQLPGIWTAATADFRQFLYDYYVEDDDGEIIKIPANSMVRLEF